MRKLQQAIVCMVTLVCLGCNMSAVSDTKIAPYKVVMQQQVFEVRYYDSMIWVSAPMEAFDQRSGAFRKLFNYISGDNSAEKKIAMTAPVFMDKGEKGTESGSLNMMSFVMPDNFSLDSTPLPIGDDLVVQQMTDYTVATIRFSGRLTNESVQENIEALKIWLLKKNFEAVGPVKVAGYNSPFTPPALRRNEVLIPIKPL